MRIILASGSPRRKELLMQAGYNIEVIVSEADENVEQDNPVQMVEELAYRKAEAVAQQIFAQDMEESCLIIGADTIVVRGRRVLGKPADREAAYRMIWKLAGKTHYVYTGVAMLYLSKDKQLKVYRMHEKTDVNVRAMSHEEILSYIDGCDDWKDKAGGYGIQTAFGAKYIPAIHGDYYNVVGLPVCKVSEYIDRFIKEENPEAAGTESL